MIHKVILKIYTWFLRPFFGTIVLAILCAWINDPSIAPDNIFSYNDVLIASLVASFVLIFPTYLLINYLGDKHKKLKITIILLIIFIEIPIVGYFSDTTTLFRKNLLNDTIIYNGPMSEPLAIVLSNGEIMSWFVGQVNLFTKPETSIADVENLVASINGTILTKIPALGFYLIETKDDIEVSVAKLEEKEFVVAVEPNLMIVPAGNDIVDLTDTNNNSNELVASFLNSPDPGADIITVEIDIFKGNHGATVNGVREAMGARGPVLQIDVGGVKCGESYCSSADRVYSALSAVLAGAEMNKQKVVLNISLAVMPLTNNPAIFSEKNGEGSNSWATTQWESFAKGILNIVEASEWAKKDKVIISQAAGNGACLLDNSNNPLSCTGVDLSALMVFNMLEENNIYFYGVEEKGKPAEYSNHGGGVIMKELEEGSQGTSIASAQGWAETEKVWQANKKLGSKQIKEKLTRAVCPGGLQVCVNGCIPTNAECCNSNVYCLKPGGSCLLRKPGTCSICPVGQKFCGMFCVDIARECQKEVADLELPQSFEPVVEEEKKSSPPSNSTPATNEKVQSQNTIECNGKQWGQCSADEQFYCPAKGDPYCGVKGKILCNGDYYNCNSGAELQCFPDGPQCAPMGVTLNPLCAGKRSLPCEAGLRFVCGATGGYCEPKESQQEQPAQPMQPAQQTPPSNSPSSSFNDYDPNACTRKVNRCQTACDQEKDACVNLCPTGSGGGWEICAGVCHTQYGACLSACTCD